MDLKKTGGVIMGCKKTDTKKDTKKTPKKEKKTKK